MKYEEALQSVLMYCSEECGKIDSCRGEYKECVEATVIKALEKQIPKKPLHMHKNYYCPICKEDGWMLSRFSMVGGKLIQIGQIH